MEKEFVPYELAVKLKELGFDEECIAWYLTDMPIGAIHSPILSSYLSNWSSCRDRINAPLWQQVFDWFREKYNIDSTILPTSNIKYLYRLYEQQSKSKTQIYGEYMGTEYKTYEEARQACLEKLIELCEKKIT